MRTPYRDPLTGRVILDVKVISSLYLRGWFPLDLMSVLPFEFLQYIAKNDQLSTLTLIRLIRLARLFKLLRILRASRKLKQAQLASGLRYLTIALLKV
jgi:hypothetical protein